MLLYCCDKIGWMKKGKTKRDQRTRQGWAEENKLFCIEFKNLLDTDNIIKPISSCCAVDGVVVVKDGCSRMGFVNQLTYLSTLWCYSKESVEKWNSSKKGWLVNDKIFSCLILIKRALKILSFGKLCHSLEIFSLRLSNNRRWAKSPLHVPGKVKNVD